ncbi:hypothetical protein NC652_032206 [Populus alba x Populus x berolinensis]|uniref:Uncharacterized protein n=1 Tax=Populus alba x Populus x berolinensis TaxID=444605 RepID=A0AAD6LQT7_9ROSI|nr:hypothetical protein NC652_032206 [Populus alba x Populus x berolinensis]KAJ6971523.1 hypothetical protein NC653_032131 [Populus alba x Populus x berolinensis]
MKTKAQNQSKFMRVMTIPVRVLCKARDVYVKSMTDFLMRMSNGPSMALLAGQHPPLPRSFSVGSSRITDSLSLGHSNEIEMNMQQLRQQQSSMTMGSKKVLPKSSSVGMHGKD